ncbi:tail fiber domain-containing protein [Winogradskyella sp.]|uniref:tail fiber domain-containing protein n=1 Tax=Winogradskyella sp. TaxID=1883156 RepID=UPI002638DF88|nr:tail fiber domain-containing protein [Winogradskyella sp.]
MKTRLLLFSLSFLLSVFVGYSQVGVGNTNPQASLDISASSTTTPANNDGILIPRMSAFPSTSPTAAQDGMLIFYTGTGASGKGFYYWNNNTTSWIIISGVTDNDWYEEGSFNPPDNINDNIYTLGAVGIGLNSVTNGKLQVTSNFSEHAQSIYLTSAGTGTGSGTMHGIYNQTTVSDVALLRGLHNRLEGDDINNVTGVRNEFLTTGSGSRYGMFNSFSNFGTPSIRVGVQNHWTGGTTNTNYGFFNSSPPAFTITGSLYGVYNDFDSSGNGQRYGTYNTISGTGSGAKYGTYSLIASTAGGTHYGIYSDVQKASGFAGYFIGRTSLGNSSSNRYLMPSADGTNGQVMTTDGAGNISFQTINTTDTDWIEVGGDIERQSGNVYIGDTNATNNQLYISDRIFDWDNVSYFLNPDGDNRVDEIQFDAGTTADPSIRFADLNTGFFSPTITTTAYSANGTEAFRIQNDGEFSLGLTTPTDYLFSVNSLGNQNSVRIGNDVNSDDNVITVNHGAQRGNSIDVSVNSVYTLANRSAISAFNNNGDTQVDIAKYASGSFNFYGVEVTIPVNGSGTEYGIYSNVQTTNGFAGYFLGDVSIGTTTINTYTLPASRGTNGQIMRSDGVGNVSWVDPSLVVTDTDDQTIDNFSLSGTTLRLSLEDDGQPLQTVNLASLQDGTGNDWTTTGNAGTNPSTNFIGTTDNQDLAIRTNNTEKVRITAKGQIETTQLQSVWIGENAGNAVTTGTRNTFVGRNSGIAMTTGVDNTAIGGLTLSTLTAGRDNTALGLGSLLDLQIGNGNTSLGEQAAENLVNGSFNVVIGHTAGENMNGSSNIFIGHAAGLSMTGSNKLVIDNADNGTASFIYGEMDNEILRANAQVEVTRNSGATISHIELSETQANDGARIRMTNSIETTNEWLLFGRADNTTSESRFNINHTTTGNIIHIRGDGRVGINDSNPTYALELPNSATASVGQGRANAWVNYSDGRVKKNQQTIPYGLETILKMTPKSYMHHSSSFDNGLLQLDQNSKTRTIGFIAQELAEVLPEATFVPKNENKELWSVNYDKIIPVTVKAIQELNSKIETLEAENAALKEQLNKMAQLEARLLAIEKNMIGTTVNNPIASNTKE